MTVLEHIPRACRRAGYLCTPSPVTCDRPLTSEQRERLAIVLREELGEKVPIVILPYGLTLSVLRQESEKEYEHDPQA